MIFIIIHTDECTRITSSGIVFNTGGYDRIDMLNERYHLNLEYPEDSIPFAGYTGFPVPD